MTNPWTNANAMTNANACIKQSANVFHHKVRNLFKTT